MDSTDTEIFDHVEEDKDLESQVNKGQPVSWEDSGPAWEKPVSSLNPATDKNTPTSKPADSGWTGITSKTDASSS
jgi:protein phosphatase 2C family protein 2/3